MPTTSRKRSSGILLLLVENIGELLDDDAWLRGQLDLVQEVITGPLMIQSLQEAEKRLKEVIYKQSMSSMACARPPPR